MLNKVVNWGHCESSHSVGSFKAVFFMTNALLFFSAFLFLSIVKDEFILVV